ncbi:stress response membrane protein YncL [Enterobacteriaceae bacterium 89]|nr:stress response membrane protein YncL [Enterobacteriaceae bacterium 89]
MDVSSRTVFVINVCVAVALVGLLSFRYGWI